MVARNRKVGNSPDFIPICHLGKEVSHHFGGIFDTMGETSKADAFNNIVQKCQFDTLGLSRFSFVLF